MTTDPPPPASIQPPPLAAQPPPAGAPLRPHRGVVILVFGILGLIVCFPFGIAAWALGNGDLREMREGRMDPTGEGLTQGGRICGIVSVLLTVVIALVALLALLVFGASLNVFHR